MTYQANDGTLWITRRDATRCMLDCFFITNARNGRKKGRNSTARQSSGGGSRNVSNAGCYWLASGFIVPWRSCPIHGTDMGLQGGFPPRIDANQRRKGQWRSKRNLCERRWPLGWVGDGQAALDAEMSRKSSVRDGGRMREGKVTALTAALLVRNGVEAHSPVP